MTAILDRTGGHPYGTQELCYALGEEVDDGAVAGTTELERALERVLRSENAHFTRVWETASRNQRLVLQALGRSRCGRSRPRPTGTATACPPLPRSRRHSTGWWPTRSSRASGPAPTGLPSRSSPTGSAARERNPLLPLRGRPSIRLCRVHQPYSEALTRLYRDAGRLRSNPRGRSAPCERVDRRGAARAARAGPLRDQAGDRRAGRDARACPRLPARRRAPPDRRCARPRQDADDQDDRAGARRELPEDPVHTRPRPLRPRRHARLPPQLGRVRHRARPGLLQISCSQTRSTAHPRRCSRPYSR